jgi:hypothetical protein
MRLYVVLASFAAVVGLATPAHADPDPRRHQIHPNRGEHLLPPAHRGSGNTAATNAAGASGPALLPVASATGCVGRAGRPTQRAPVLCPASLRGPSQRRPASMSMAPAWDDDAREIFRNTLNHT